MSGGLLMTDEDASTQEFEIAVNGPNLAYCDTVVKEAMDQYWMSKSKDGVNEWHFVKTSIIEKLKKYIEGSEDLHRMLATENNLPFMSYLRSLEYLLSFQPSKKVKQMISNLLPNLTLSVLNGVKFIEREIVAYSFCSRILAGKLGRARIISWSV
jgi:hypothetical protein